MSDLGALPGVPAHAPNPFNFQTQVISASPVNSSFGQRRGHRYKHSNVSIHYQAFPEPVARPPSAIPSSLPVPTLREAWDGMQRDQRMRLYWCCCHLAVAIFIFFRAADSLAMTALSHLVFFDAGSAAVCVAVDLLGNFDVWRRSTVRHPFGLERAEVLAGFAMSVFLLFGGFDLVSHGLRHALESIGHSPDHGDHDHPYHPSHHAAAHLTRVSPGTVDWASLAAIVSTLVSAYGLRNHARVSRIMRVSYLASLPIILSNPSHFLTLSFSSLLLLLPLLSVAYHAWIDRLVCAAIALSMFLLGTRLAVAQALMLLMSYPGARASAPTAPDRVTGILREVEADPAVARIDDAQFWQVHYGLALASLRLVVPKTTAVDQIALSMLRSRISSLIQNRLGEGYGRGGSLRWEITIQMSRDHRTCP